MTYLRRKYTEFEIFSLDKSLEEDPDAHVWLKNNCQELAALSDIIVDNNKSAMKWLVKNEFDILAKFILALRGDREAYEYLYDSEYDEWAAIISYLDNNNTVENWFEKNDLNHYKLLAQTIRTIINQNFSDSGGVSGGGGSGGSSGGGFGGLGGGSFGGGGAGSAW